MKNLLFLISIALLTCSLLVGCSSTTQLTIRADSIGMENPDIMYKDSLNIKGLKR